MCPASDAALAFVFSTSFNINCFVSDAGLVVNAPLVTTASVAPCRGETDSLPVIVVSDVVKKSVTGEVVFEVLSIISKTGPVEIDYLVIRICFEYS